MRDALGELDYWDERIEKDYVWLGRCSKLLSVPSKNPEYKPQFTFDISMDVVRLILQKYSRGG